MKALYLKAERKLVHKFRRDAVGVVWLGVGIFCALALASYRPEDPSFNSIGASLVARNWCGYIGSFLADGLYQLLGAAAWALPLAAARVGVRCFFGERTEKASGQGFWNALAILVAASLAELHFPHARFFSGHISVGGAIGSTVVHGLIAAFNFAGVAVLLWSLAALLAVFYSDRGPAAVLSSLYVTLARKTREFLAGWREASAAQKRALSRIQERDDLAREKAHDEKREAAERGKRREREAKSSGEAAASLVRRKLFNFPKLSIFGKRSKETSEKPLTETEKQARLADLRSHAARAATSETSADAKFGAASDSRPAYRGDSGEASEASSESTDSGSSISAEAERASHSSDPADLPRRKVRLTAKIERRIENWKLPELGMLEDPPASRLRVDEREIRMKSELLTNKLAQFSVNGEVQGAKPGPAVTMYEFRPNADVKISKIVELADDLSLALSSESVRIIAPIPGRDVVGIETSNAARETVYLKDILAHDPFWSEKMKLPVALGRQADGEPRVVDLRRMPHLMVAGTTGSGKSVFVVSTITGLLFRHSPKTLRLILIDPKQVDLAAFAHVPHLLMPPIREPKKAVTALKWAIREMDKRYRSMSRFGTRDLEGYNAHVEKLGKAQLDEHEKINEDLEAGNHRNEQYYFTPQPYVVIVVEEFGDLMAVDKVNVEQSVVRLAQMARACGIHLILAMQSPRKDVVTGLIKTNIPGRISFKVASKMDSRIILDDSGAERLLANGDMLYLAPGVAKPQRHHGPWVTEAEIMAIMSFWAEQGEPQFDPLAMKALEGSGGGFEFNGASGEEGVDGGDVGEGDDYDERYDEILSYVSAQKEVSASLLQRKFKLGYPRAARMIELFEREGVVGPAHGSKPRQVLVKGYEKDA